MVMSFGSGDISTQVASDQVQLGAVTCSAEVMASPFCSFSFVWCDTGVKIVPLHMLHLHLLDFLVRYKLTWRMACC